MDKWNRKSWNKHDSTIQHASQRKLNLQNCEDCLLGPGIPWKILVIRLNYRWWYFFAGSDFSLILNFTTVNGTGTGEDSILVRTVDGLPLFGEVLTEPQPPGTYVLKWDSAARPDPNCDPTQGFCERWLPGNYTVYVGMHCLFNVQKACRHYCNFFFFTLQRFAMVSVAATIHTAKFMTELVLPSMSPNRTCSCLL